MRLRCGRGWFLRIGDRADWSYLLPARLGRGRYVLEVKATDGAFNRGTPARGRFRVALMRLALLSALRVLPALAAPAGAAAPRVEPMVVGKERVLREPATVSRPRARCGSAAGAARSAARRRCPCSRARARAAAARLRVLLRSPADAGALFVPQSGPIAPRSRGWAYKVGPAPARPAADPSGPSAPGADRRGRLLWFWCVRRAGGCQRTLRRGPRAAPRAAGAALRVTVRGYDDAGRGRPLPARWSPRRPQAPTGTDGRAALTAPARLGRPAVTAERAGLVPSFPCGWRSS